jgi:hypothetical protein
MKYLKLFAPCALVAGLLWLPMAGSAQYSRPLPPTTRSALCRCPVCPGSPVGKVNFDLRGAVTDTAKQAQCNQWCQDQGCRQQRGTFGALVPQ